MKYFGEPLGEPKYKLDETIWVIFYVNGPAGECSRGQHWREFMGPTFFGQFSYADYIYAWWSGWSWSVFQLQGPSYSIFVKGSDRDFKKRHFQIHLYQKHIYHLKALKKLYKRHLNGTYRFLIRNSENPGWKLRKVLELWPQQVFLATLSHNFHYFWWQIDMFRLNVFYITFWELSDGIYVFLYRWFWKWRFLKSRSEPFTNIL